MVIKDNYILPDDNLIYHPCSKTTGFKTVRELAIVNTKNRNCIEKYEVIIERLIEWKSKQKELVDGK